MGFCRSPELLWRAALPCLSLFLVFLRIWPSCQPLAAVLGSDSILLMGLMLLVIPQRAEPLQTHVANGLINKDWFGLQWGKYNLVLIIMINNQPEQRLVKPYCESSVLTLLAPTAGSKASVNATRI